MSKDNTPDKILFKPAEIMVIEFDTGIDIICTSGPETPCDNFD